MPNETRELSRFISVLSDRDIPASARARAIDLLVDQLGCEIGCSGMPWAKQVRDTYSSMGGTHEATTIVYGDRLPASTAAFINSTFGHSFDYDDSNHQTRGHPGAELIPALAAISERNHISGKDFLTALIATYELRGRIGWAVSREMVHQGGPHPSTACGPIGAAAGVGRLLGLSPEKIEHAMGIAGCFSGGLMQYSRVGGAAKRIVPAVAASSGIQAAQLAQAGMSGPAEIIEGQCGLMRTYTKEFHQDRLLKELGTTWTIELAFFKLYSCNGNIHPAIEALKEMVATHHLTPNDVAGVEVSYPLSHHGVISGDAPKDFLGMQFSTSYTLAITMLKGRNSPHEYTMAVLDDPEIRDFAAKVKVNGDAELTELAEREVCEPARVRITTRSGQIHQMIARKGVASLASSAVVDNKFRSQVIDVLGKERCEQALAAIRGIDAIKDYAELPSLLVAKS